MQVHQAHVEEDLEGIQQPPQQAGQVNRADQEVAVENQQGDAGGAAGEVPAPAVELPQGAQNYVGDVHADLVREFRIRRNTTIQTLKDATANFPDVADFNKIMNTDMMLLREGLQNGQWTAVQVVSAFVKRAIEIDKHLNCITQMMDNPIEVARQLDEQGERGPLFGLPFSIKSNFHVRGCPTTIGLAKQLRENRYPAATCQLVDHLIRRGAVPICLTNVPQGLLAYVTSNPLHGTTKNPWDLDRTPGGSSGGEAALIAAGGACFGIGNDLVGSLRIPAAFCGLVSLKPTEARIPEMGMHPGPERRGRLGLSSGVFTRTVEEQYFLLRLIVRFYHPTAPLEEIGFPGPADHRIPENDQRVKRLIAYYSDDGFTPVVPSHARAVEETVRKLSGEFYFKRVTLSELCGITPFQLSELLFKNVMIDNGVSMNRLYSGEKNDDHMSFFTNLLSLKQWRFVNWLANSLLGQFVTKRYVSTRGACLARSVNPTPQDEIKSQGRVEDIRTTWKANWQEKGYYALICPAFITPAQPFKYPAKLATGTFATGLFNMLDVPAGVVPVNPVSAQEVEQLQTFDTQGDRLLRWQKEAAENSQNLPNAVQVVAGSEEDCLYVMNRIEAVNRDVQKLVYIYEGEETNMTSQELFNRVKKMPELPGDN